MNCKCGGRLRLSGREVRSLNTGANRVPASHFLRPSRAFVFHRVLFPGRCPGLEYCALSGLKIALGSPCKGRLNKAQGNALRKDPGSRIMSPKRARYVRHVSKDSSRRVRIAPRFLLFVNAGVGMRSRFPHGLGPRTVPPPKCSHTPAPQCGRISVAHGARPCHSRRGRHTAAGRAAGL